MLICTANAWKHIQVFPLLFIYIRTGFKDECVLTLDAPGGGGGGGFDLFNLQDEHVGSVLPALSHDIRQGDLRVGAGKLHEAAGTLNMLSDSHRRRTLGEEDKRHLNFINHINKID